MKRDAILILACITFVAFSGDRALAGPDESAKIPITVIRISEEYQNINTSITDTTLAEHGIVHGERFDVAFKEHRFTAFLGKTYKDVDKGAWIALIEDDHRLQIAISYGNAATEIGCAVGDTLLISPLEE